MEEPCGISWWIWRQPGFRCGAAGGIHELPLQFARFVVSGLRGIWIYGGVLGEEGERTGFAGVGFDLSCSTDCINRQEKFAGLLGYLQKAVA
jgi:hypothetical protein